MELSLFGDKQFAGGFGQTRDDQNQRAHIPRHVLSSFRDYLVEKRVELQRTDQMQCQPWTTRLSQVLHANPARVDFDPSRLRRGIIIKFKSQLPPERLQSFRLSSWLDRLARLIGGLLWPSPFQGGIGALMS